MRDYPTFCAALAGGFTFLRWSLCLVLDHASSARLENASHAASRFLAALFSAWFSLGILNHRDMEKFDRKNSKQIAQDQQYGVTDDVNLKFQISTFPNPQVSQLSPINLAGNTIDLTLFAVTRAFDSLFINLYRQSRPAVIGNGPAFSILNVTARYANTLIFALSSSTVVRL